ncbi:MAG: 2,4-dienoyl-CoA reductase-like NADH-dependent reductase (Old Yellow Enzyme family) [Candidatus Poriferisodalaceae bacterium]|jgi:2,4-dienoyl-CoA reductase-like NADH-dependent reductase (Old Yellow Enzyme family)
MIGKQETSARFATLLSPITLGPVTVRNRIVSCGHATHIVDGCNG